MKNGTVWDYEYNLTDLPIAIGIGNVRVVIHKGTSGTAEVLQEKHYYPFGMEMSELSYNYGSNITNKYQYNGKELQDDYGLYWYDYGARFYDPMLGRWHSVDPKAELGRRWSPYVYGFDNPMMFLDPDGMWGLPYMEKINRRTATNANTAFVWNVAAEIYNGVAGAVNLISDAITDPSSVPSGAEMARGAAESLQNIDLSNPDTQEKIVAGVVTFAAGELLMAGKAPKPTTEIVERAMSKAELNATKETGLLRGGREGTHYASGAVNNTAKDAQKRLALPVTPEVKVQLEVPAGKFSTPSKAEPKFGQPGGGMERTATGNIPVKIIKEKEYNK